MVDSPARTTIPKRSVRSHANVTAELRVTSDPGAGPATGYAQFNRAATGVRATVGGKPTRLLFDAALADLGIAAEDALMVGDDIDADVRGAQALGMTGALVRSGKVRDDDLRRGSPDRITLSMTSGHYLTS